MFPPFCSLNISCHSILACKASAAKSADNFMAVPLYITFCFSLATFRIISNFCHFNYCISCLVSVWVYLVWDPLCFLFLSIIKTLPSEGKSNAMNIPRHKIFKIIFIFALKETGNLFLLLPDFSSLWDFSWAYTNVIQHVVVSSWQWEAVVWHNG